MLIFALNLISSMAFAQGPPQSVSPNNTALLSYVYLKSPMSLSIARVPTSAWAQGKNGELHVVKGDSSGETCTLGTFDNARNTRPKFPNSYPIKVFGKNSSPRILYVITVASLPENKDIAKAVKRSRSGFNYIDTPPKTFITFFCSRPGQPVEKDKDLEDLKNLIKATGMDQYVTLN